VAPHGETIIFHRAIAIAKSDALRLAPQAANLCGPMTAPQGTGNEERNGADKPARDFDHVRRRAH